MKKVMLSVCGLVIFYAASAQISVGVNGNYTMYKQDFQKSTPGAGVRVYFNATERVAAVGSFTYGFPIKMPSSVLLSGGTGGSSVASEMVFKFKAINVMANYSFIGDDETAGKFYGIVGAGLVFVNYKENITGTYDKTVYTPADLQEGSENGFTLNFGLGGEYKIGTPALFGEVALALPANKVGTSYVTNYIPSHFLFNVGVKFTLGENE